MMNRKGFVPTQYVDKTIAENRLKKANTSHKKYIYYIENGFIEDNDDYAEYLYERRNR